MLEVIPTIVGILGILVVALIYYLVVREDPGTPEMVAIASYIQEGANAYLKRQFYTIFIFIAIIAAILGILEGLIPAISFLAGSILSLIAAYIGMNAAVKANVRTTNAARTSPAKALKIAFWGGSVMGLSVVSLSVLGIGSLYLIVRALYPIESPQQLEMALHTIVPFGMGASLAALFAQLGGGIYTKAADIAADLVGKVEAGIPEDDPRNPAVIADQVGDNVGDCAGRGADLFESFSDNIIGMMILGVAFYTLYGLKGVLFPLMAESAGVISTIIAIFLIREKTKNPITAINVSLFVSGVLNAIFFYYLAVELLGDYHIFLAAILGLIASLVVGVTVQYYTGTGYRPVKYIAESSQFGPALDVIAGLAVGLESAFVPLIVIAAVVSFAYIVAGLYGIAAATAGILSTTGIIMAADTFGPISDNAAGIAEMAGLSKEVREGLDLLDAVGNTTKAITKGYAMACAILSAFVLFSAYLSAAKLTDVTMPRVDLADPFILVGLILGSTLAYLFSALAIRAVGKTANKMVEEVRRQFREIPGLLEGKAKPDYARAVDISTKHALKEMVLPTLITFFAPIIIGLLFHRKPLGAFIVGATVAGGLLAVFMINAGGALDNAKKLIESGLYGGKGSEAHKSAVVGDTVGDPLKDTAGPSLHIFVKLVTIVALTFVAFFPP
ncbi:MAG: sodium-translocating pyrophosphatase [Candidatus Korarchaeota archaeon]|nr:sodium-translocating pyrophosphatase [Candidatus Korarchaeota archaeon]